jgi:hypothetical protein
VGTIVAHLGEASFPRPGPGELEDSARLDAAHEVFESAFDRARIGPFAGKSDGLFEKFLTKHKICPFSHV